MYTLLFTIQYYQFIYIKIQIMKNILFIHLILNFILSLIKSNTLYKIPLIVMKPFNYIIIRKIKYFLNK